MDGETGDEGYRRLGLLAPSRRVPIPGGPQDVANILDATLNLDPGREALVGRHSRFTYRELDAAINAAAKGLAALNVEQGVRVAAALSNHPEAVVAYLATQRLGAIWVGVNPKLTHAEKTVLFSDVSPTVLLLDAEEAAGVSYRSALPASCSVIGVSPANPDCEWKALLGRNAGAGRPPVVVDPYAPAAISFTSGTTGRPKGAVHSQHGILVCAWGANAGMRGELGPIPSTLRRGSVSVMSLNAMINCMLIPLAGGGAGVCVDRRDALGIAEWIERERIAVISLATPVIYDLVRRYDVAPDKLASLKFVTSLGSPIPQELRAAFEQRFRAPILAGYGQTEAPGPVAGASLDRPPKGETAGLAHRHIEIAILDTDDRTMPPGHQGQICARAAATGPWAGVYTPMLGYWHRAEATEAALRNGWLHTGDIGSLDADGYVTVHGRLSDMILRGGANVYPAEIEQVISRDRRVAAVAIVGQPDPRLGERVVAFVQTVPGIVADKTLAAELKEACGHELSRYKVPEEWIFVEAFPRGPTDKILKPLLQQMYFHGTASVTTPSAAMTAG